MHRSLFCSAMGLLLLAACTGDTPPPRTAVPETPATMIPDEPSPAAVDPTDTPQLPAEPQGEERGAMPDQQLLDGNRYIEGQGRLPEIEPVDILLSGRPVWIAAVALANGDSGWGVTLEDGRQRSYGLWGGEVIEGSVREAGQNVPPVLRRVVSGDAASSQLLPIPADMAPASVPLWLETNLMLAYVNTNGDLVIDRLAAPGSRGRDVTTLPLNALPDARLVVNERRGLLLVLTGPTDRYGHGVLGDRLEASAIALVSYIPREPDVVRTIPIEPPLVIEGLAPLWADVDGDGRDEIVVTLSDAAAGARLVVYSEEGSVRWESEAIGQGNRWRHQLAVAPFGPEGALLLADVLTPHIGGVVEFFRPVEGRLERVGQLSGYTSHVIGSRNLEMALAADWDGDGRVELLLPDQARNALGAIVMGPEGAEVAWSLPLPARLTTNIAGVTLSDGTAVAGAGLEDSRLLIWAPAR